jgi:hypothetical protein
MAAEHPWLTATIVVVLVIVAVYVIRKLFGYLKLAPSNFGRSPNPAGP